jgi:hypothetical protein
VVTRTSNKFINVKERKLSPLHQTNKCKPTFSPLDRIIKLKQTLCDRELGPRQTLHPRAKKPYPTSAAAETDDIASSSILTPTTVTNMSRRANLSYAVVAKHRANMVKPRHQPPRDNPTVPPKLSPENQPYSLI